MAVFDGLSTLASHFLFWHEKVVMEFQMECPEGHTWIETFPVDHPLFGRCPKCPTNKNTGKVVNRVDPS